MTNWRDASGEGALEGERRSGRWSGAGGLKRVVRVAEELRMDPQIVRVALEREDGSVRTDVSLRDSIRAVERALNRESRPPRVVGPRP